MSYHLYNTTGFVLRSADLGEANKLLFIFTENLGLVGAHAQSARKVSSKLRYGLREYSFSRLSLIRGKTSWRLTDAEEIISFSPTKETQKIKVFAGILSLVGRFVHGEEENSALFHELKDAAAFLKDAKFTNDELHRFETLAVLKILSALGYIGENKDLKFYIRTPFNASMLEQFTPHRRSALKEINRALEESHL
ncbi:MAG: DNA repair protein RecO [Candidatus Paceibacterota bacterium]|nr:DNA repair protein RecO [Candidatus Paceibacterota bacterium]